MWKSGKHVWDGLSRSIELVEELREGKLVAQKAGPELSKIG